MSNSYLYWGRRAGAVMKDGTGGIRQQQWGGGVSNSGSRPKRFYWPMVDKRHPQRKPHAFISPNRPWPSASIRAWRSPALPA